MPNSQRLAERAITWRLRRFVGRESERNLFWGAVVADELPFHLLYVYGPGGTGKTGLLREFARLAGEAGIANCYLDARNVEPSPEGFCAALSRTLGLPPAQSVADALSSRERRHVLLIDSIEALTPVEGWLREEFLPQLPEDTLIVLADRKAPTPSWRSDSDWQGLMRTLALRNLTPQESRDYLCNRGVPSEQHAAILDFTHGHPLALSLVSDLFDQLPTLEFRPEAAPDVVKLLLGQFIQRVPSPAHRAALEACSLLRLTTEPLLAAVLHLEDAHELFEWLRELSFVEAGPLGLFPHELAREALAADLRWRNPDWHAELHRRARDYYAGRLQQTRGQEQQRALFDCVYLHRHSPAVRRRFDWRESGTIMPDSMRPGDVRELVRMVARHEGEESARLAAYWMERQPEGVLVFRDEVERAAGFMGIVALERVTIDDLAVDPAADQTWEYIQSRGPLRSGERAFLVRFWMAAEGYQSVSAIQSLIFVSAARHCLNTAALAFTLFPCAEPDLWAEAFGYVDMPRIPAADFTVGGRRYGMYGRDWRTAPPSGWVALLGEREVASRPLEPRDPQPAPLVVVLSQPDFDSAVREAFRDLSRADALFGNPLLRSRIVTDRAGISARVSQRAAVLQDVLTEAVRSLRDAPRQEKSYQALYHTYIRPAPTQEAAAELLDLPFSTFRRHLKAGMVRVAEILWQVEIGAV